MTYELNAFEQAVVRNLVKSIYKDNSHQRGTKIDIANDTIESKIENFGGELAFCRMMNIYPDLSIHSEQNKVDFIFEGLKGDVKHTAKGVRLAVPPYLNTTDNPIDVYTLVTGVFPRYTYHGWSWSADVFKQENIEDLGMTMKPYCIHKDKLHKTKIGE